MVSPLFSILLAALSGAADSESAAKPGVLVGPGRFCGYSPIIDLLPGERVVLLDGGIHGGRFRWEGQFGTLRVSGIGWAARLQGDIEKSAPNGEIVKFRQVKEDGRYRVAIWNQRHGAAYFSSRAPLTERQLAAIDRVDLFEEGEEPKGCELRTVFSWDY